MDSFLWSYYVCIEFKRKGNILGSLGMHSSDGALMWDVQNPGSYSYCMPVIPASWRSRQVDQQFSVTFNYIESLRVAWAP